MELVFIKSNNNDTDKEESSKQKYFMSVGKRAKKLREKGEADPGKDSSVKAGQEIHEEYEDKEYMCSKKKKVNKSCPRFVFTLMKGVGGYKYDKKIGTGPTARYFYRDPKTGKLVEKDKGGKAVSKKPTKEMPVKKPVGVEPKGDQQAKDDKQNPQQRQEKLNGLAKKIIERYKAKQGKEGIGKQAAEAATGALSGEDVGEMAARGEKAGKTAERSLTTKLKEMQEGEEAGKKFMASSIQNKEVKKLFAKLGHQSHKNIVRKELESLASRDKIKTKDVSHYVNKYTEGVSDYKKSLKKSIGKRFILAIKKIPQLLFKGVGGFKYDKKVGTGKFAKYYYKDPKTGKLVEKKPSERDKTSEELKLGLQNMVDAYKGARSSGDTKLAIKIRDKIEKIIKKKNLDANKVWGEDPDKPKEKKLGFKKEEKKEDIFHGANVDMLEEARKAIDKDYRLTALSKIVQANKKEMKDISDKSLKEVDKIYAKYKDRPMMFVKEVNHIINR